MVEASSIGGIVCNNIVVMHVVPGRNGASTPVSDRGDIREPVPRVEGPMVGRLPTSVEQQVLAHLTSPAEAVVEVDSRPRQVESDVAQDTVLGAHCLEVAARLLLKHSNLVAEVVRKGHAPRLVSAAAVVALGPPPERHAVHPQPGEVVVRDLRVSVEPRQEHRGRVESLKFVAADAHVPRSLEKHGPDALQRPVAPGGDAVRLHVCGPARCEADAFDLDVFDRMALVSPNLDEARVAGNYYRRRGPLLLHIRTVVVEIEQLLDLVEEKLIRRVQLLEHIVDPPLPADVRALAALVAAL
mmetsp:Transcript_14583/g.26228  ORF Transcript_14583/g.26228 Transcript_14583/m.26228 type:complete len:299 (+) Transcript_14583:531-1427(+)|eukprot:CAMPEP_0197543380 /NCGR_PEP_ID=MMETSP1318-20131121/68147_1 /TAXON_ID=552666 /ORGANISM="Partenskyella glossopodia, Strain RCC365" /LENGTH=298 /DNA_ID=CAMNT_0043102713 /DNA_START=891 /DNA_END=1787 /DNA_ORIENTATION=+